MFSLFSSLSLRCRASLPLLAPRRLFSTQAPSPLPLSEGEQGIYDKLRNKFSPSELHVQDISGGCGSFYAISITSDAFKGLSTVKPLKTEIEGIHGLQIKTTSASD